MTTSVSNARIASVCPLASRRLRPPRWHRGPDSRHGSAPPAPAGGPRAVSSTRRIVSLARRACRRCRCGASSARTPRASTAALERQRVGHPRPCRRRADAGPGGAPRDPRPPSCSASSSAIAYSNQALAVAVGRLVTRLDGERERYEGRGSRVELVDVLLELRHRAYAREAQADARAWSGSRPRLENS